ncbi:MAG: DNA polymerase III subunit gamma/tau [Treponema sp.]|jgi:DNA polymerase-3 subunit gamma/tau|nr:DNA polymerase III subunit gamma/tau [Treponema sp.]
MAYEVTATRRRPKTFDELAGQEFVVATLKNSIETGHIAHAYLFSGPRGCGKTSAARILARSLNCDQGPTANPCGVCPSCQEIARGASLDIIEIDGASNTGVNDVRQIKDEVLFPPNAGRYKVYIIDEVHMLSNSAFNALLKTIEEPPPYIVFIFATTELHKVPATIKSRCQQFAFRLIPLETITGILKATCQELGLRFEDDALFWVARESTGSMRDAYTLFDQVVSFSDGHIRSALIREKLGLVGLDNLNALAEACAAGDLARAFTVIDDILNAGVAIEQFIIDLVGYYHNLLFLRAGITRTSLLDYHPDRFSATVLQSLHTVQLEHALELLLALYRDIRYSVSPRFELEMVISKLCCLDQWISPQDLRAAIAGVQAALGGSLLEGGNRPLPVARPKPLPADAVSDQQAVYTTAPSGNETAAVESRPVEAVRPERPNNLGSLSEGFKRMLAARESGTSSPSTPTVQDSGASSTPVAKESGASAPSAPVVQDSGASSVPVAGESGASAPSAPAVQDSGASSVPAVQESDAALQHTPELRDHDGQQGKAKKASRGAPKKAAPVPQVERVLRVFRGTIVKHTQSE